MSFNPYYTGYGGWGTQQYAMPMAPRVGYMPQAGWRGLDFYNAHSQWHGLDPDQNFFNQTMHHVESSSGAGGFSKAEAQMLHDQIYSGMTDVRTASPDELGAAAAFEAMRYWETNYAVWQMPTMDFETEEDSIIGLAIAEAMKLWAYAGGMPYDSTSRYACESAAATVHRIYRYDHRGMFAGNGAMTQGGQRGYGGLYGGYPMGGYGAGYGAGAGAYGVGPYGAGPYGPAGYGAGGYGAGAGMYGMGGYGAGGYGAGAGMYGAGTGGYGAGGYGAGAGGMYGAGAYGGGYGNPITY